MAEINEFSALDELDSELEDRFGPLPDPVKNLLYQLKIKLLATQAGIERIASEGSQICLEMPQERPLDELSVDLRNIRRSKRGLWLGTTTPSWRQSLETVLQDLKRSER